MKIDRLSDEDLTEAEFDERLESYRQRMHELRQSMDNFRRRARAQRRAQQIVTRAVRQLSDVFNAYEF